MKRLAASMLAVFVLSGCGYRDVVDESLKKPISDTPCMYYPGDPIIVADCEFGEKLSKLTINFVKFPGGIEGAPDGYAITARGDFKHLSENCVISKDAKWDEDFTKLKTLKKGSLVCTFVNGNVVLKYDYKKGGIRVENRGYVIAS